MNNNINKISPASSIEINQKVYDMKRDGKDVITLSLGEAFFDIPDFGFSKVNHNVGYHYTDTQGLPKLRKEILKYYNIEHSIESISENNIIISAGSKVLTYLSFLLTLEQNDEVILHEPAWLSYEDQSILCGASVKYIPYNVSIESFDTFFSKRTKAIVINNPNNPSGFVYDHKKLEQLIIKANERNIYVILDEAYSDFVTDDLRFFSCVDLVNSYSNLIVINSISKNFGMSGWRIGYLIANERIIEKMIMLNQHTITCAPTVLQMYLAEHLMEIHKVCKQQIDTLLDKRQKVTEICLHYGLTTLPGGATFYKFIDISKSKMSSESFANMLLDKYSVAVVPGSAYGRTTDNFVRLSFGTESIERIEYAIKSMASECDQCQ